jgi:hypothetical protein
MMTPYVFRLLCLSLAAFFVVHAAVGLPVSLAVPWAVRMAGGVRPRLAARLLLGLRLLPPLSCFAGRCDVAACHSPQRAPAPRTPEQVAPGKAGVGWVHRVCITGRSGLL